MGTSRSQYQVLILDCCHSGAIAKGMKGSEKVQVLPKLGGQGRAILTASDSREYAFEQEGFELSLYTHFLVEGLKTGIADRDRNGEITVDELYDYVRPKVRSVNDRMSPEFHPVREGYRIILAKAALDDPKLKFRKEIEAIITRRKGKIVPSTRQLITNDKIKHGITDHEAEEIEQEVLKPLQEYDRNLKAYAKLVQETIDNEFPWDEVTQEEIEQCEVDSGLRPEDIQQVKSRILVPRQVEYERQQQETKNQAEQLSRQQALEAELLKQQQESNSTQPEFDFEYAKVRLVKESGVFGIGQSTKIELERYKGKAQYIRENLGNGSTLDLVRIPAEEFMMGSDEYDGEKPIHKVRVPEFWMGKYTVTNTQWEAVMGTKPSEKYDVKFQGKNQPVVGVSWNDCQEFCKKLSNKIGKNFRLPSEAEWEYACRAGTTTPFYFGDTITPGLVNYDGNYPYGKAAKGLYRQQTTEVGIFPPNAFGLYDMHGNVWEWCSDRWHDNYENAPIDGGSWEASTNELRVLRGGSWYYHAWGCCSANRLRYSADGCSNGFGFRVVCVSVLPRTL